MGGSLEPGSQYHRMAILRVYFSSSAVPLSASVIGSLLSLTPLLMRNFLPSAACFYGKLSLIP
jgi:hypothetical protein